MSISVDWRLASGELLITRSRANLSHSRPLLTSCIGAGNLEVLGVLEPDGRIVGQSDCLNPSLEKDSDLPTVSTKFSSSQKTKKWSVICRSREGISPWEMRISKIVEIDFGN